MASPGADFVILVKPQFELERGQVGRGGIVRDPLCVNSPLRRPARLRGRPASKC